mmetsp:Transcript_8826/g.19043  ORF Transcript_8826/g.19043 Transcript_8826/m.19043 type:complete len:217 (-) Transcript_8826:725-1375(-)
MESLNSSRIFQTQPFKLLLPTTNQRIPRRHQRLQLPGNLPIVLVVQLLFRYPRKLGNEHIPAGHLRQRCGKYLSQRPSVKRRQMLIIRAVRRLARMLLRRNDRGIQIQLKFERASYPEESHGGGFFVQFVAVVDAPALFAGEEGGEGFAFFGGFFVNPFGFLDVGFQVFGDEAEGGAAGFHEGEVGLACLEKLGGVDLVAAEDGGEGVAYLVELFA